MATNYSPKIVTDGLVLCLDAANSKSYPGTGTTWTDLSGAGNHGTLINTPTYSSNNQGYFSFNGADERVSFTPFTLSTDWTIQYFFYHNNSTANDMTIGEYALNENRFYHRDAGSDYKLRVHNNAGLNVQDMAMPNRRQVWTFLSYSMTSSGVVNGWWNSTKALNNVSTGDSSTFKIDTLGRPYPSSSYFWLGYIGPVMVYEKALSDNEVAQNFSALRGRYGI